MNAATKTFPEDSWVERLAGQYRIPSQTVIAVVLMFAIFITSFSLVFVRDYSRRQFGELQSLQFQRDDLTIDWGRLLLEQSTWSTQARIEQVAARRLNMHIPKPQEVILVVP